MSEAIWESRIPARFGVSRNEVRQARKRALVEGSDWWVDNKRVCIAEEGVEKIATELGVMRSENTTEQNVHQRAQNKSDGHPVGVYTSQDLKPRALLPEQARSLIAPATPLKKTVRLFKTCVNPRIIQCRDGDGDLIRVKVKDASKFTPAMEIPIRHIEADLYELDRPEPRWRGRW